MASRQEQPAADAAGGALRGTAQSAIDYFSVGFPFFTHSFHPPVRARMSIAPRCCSMSTARALVASSRQAQ